MKLVVAILCALTLPRTCEAAVVYGLSSSYDSEADLYAPSYLFRFDLSGDSFVDLGPVLLDGAAADFDALAASPEIGLLAFQSTAAGSRLVQIDLNSLTAALLAPPLFGREIRGATFGANDQLWAVDATLDELVRVSPTTGEELDAVQLSFNALHFDIPRTTDLAVAFSGQLILVAGQEFYTVNEANGQLTLMFTDTQGEPASSQPPNLAGAIIGFSDSEKLFALDVEGAFTDDLYTYEHTGSFHRELLSSAPLQQIDAGLGDLALLLEPVSSGDYNGDGFVDASDYVVWRRTVNSSTLLSANGNDSGTSMSVIDEADYVVWRNEFGSTVPGGGLGATVSMVPEPGNVLLSTYLATAGIRWRRSRHKSWMGAEGQTV